MILNTPFIADYKYIRRRKQTTIDNNNQKENINLKPHTYRVQEKVLVCEKKKQYKEPYKGPYPITKV